MKVYKSHLGLDHGGGIGEDGDISGCDRAHLNLRFVLGSHWGGRSLPSLQCFLFALLNRHIVGSVLLQSIIGGDCGGPADRLLPAVHDGRVGHGADRRAPPCSLWTGAL